MLSLCFFSPKWLFIAGLLHWNSRIHLLDMMFGFVEHFINEDCVVERLWFTELMCDTVPSLSFFLTGSAVQAEVHNQLAEYITSRLNICKENDVTPGTIWGKKPEKVTMFSH